jgi:hypothetical protein
MRKTVSSLLLSCLAWQPALAGDVEDSTIWVTNVLGRVDSAWAVSDPTGPSDYFSVAHHVEPGNANVAVLAEALPIVGVSVSVADFGSGRTFPTVGVYRPNLTLDPTGITPDLVAPIVEIPSPPNPAPPLFTFVPFETGEGLIPPGSAGVVAAVKMPEGDSGLLLVGGSTFVVTKRSGYTSDAFTSPAIPLDPVDLGINAGQDNLAGTSCKSSDRRPNGRLRVWRRTPDVGRGDRLLSLIAPGETLNLAFFGTMPGDRFRMYLAPSPCGPTIPLGPVLATRPDPDGDGSFLRLSATWPPTFGTTTWQFSAAWGNEACPSPGAGFTNCITVISEGPPDWGRYDDGVFEDGWVAQIPSGSSDYFNINFGPPASNVHGVTELVIAPLDFVTAVPAFPATGVSNANLSIDPTGNTPDIIAPLALIAPFTFPSGTLAWSSSQMIHHPLSVPASSLGSHVHGWLQFPPGDSGLLAAAADDNYPIGPAYLSIDGYATPAIGFFDLWGIRLTHN